MLVVENISKKFPGVIALNNVSLEFEAGKVTAIIGENGAGKSTLMKILSGVYRDFDGKIVFRNKPVRFSNPKEAQDKGIAIMHQELNLVPGLSITENIFLGRERMNRWGLLDKKAMRVEAKSLLAKLKLPVDPDTPVSLLKIGQQQQVEIAKALLVKSDVIIMDEPTSAISTVETEILFGIIQDLKREGRAIVYISHKLDELFRIADKYIVLRDGAVIEKGTMKGVTQADIVLKMVGREINILRRKEATTNKDELLRVENLCLKHPVMTNQQFLQHISFAIRKGEIVGIFGLMGAGRTELLETIFGLHPARAAGHVHMEGRQLKCKTPQDAISAGLALVPEDRKKDGLILDLNVRNNISITTLSALQHFGLLNQQKEKSLCRKYVDSLQIKAASDLQSARNLSGGNQQKVVLAKWLATAPKLLMLDEPTRGIDLKAKNEIYKLIMELADAGLGIMVVSSELTEILAISDRILVMAEGKLTAEFVKTEASEEIILNAAIPKKQ